MPRLTTAPDREFSWSGAFALQVRRAAEFGRSELPPAPFKIASQVDARIVGAAMLSDRDQLILKKTLTYANGYRELEMFDEALAELDTLPEPASLQKEHIQMRLAILMEAKRWREALPFANQLASIETSDPSNLVNLAYVTRRANSIEGARVILETAAKRFPNEAIIQYNLGCYLCCVNELDTAKSHLERAFKLDPRFLETSVDDDDLQPLESWLREQAKHHN